MPLADEPLMWSVSVLGAIKVTNLTLPVTLSSTHSSPNLSPTLLRIVAALVASHPDPVDRVTLVNRVWDVLPDTSASSLRNFLVRLRTACPGLIEVSGDFIGFAPQMVELDSAIANAHIERADGARLSNNTATESTELERANSLWYGDAAFANIDAAWLVAPREFLAVRRRDVVRRLVELLDGAGDDAGLERLLRPLVSAENVPSWMISRLAEALTRLAKPEEALSTLVRATALWGEISGAQPPSAWQLLASDIWAGAIEPRHSISATALPPVLRLSTEQFVGRHEELTKLSNPLGKSLLICGQSGAGKSFLVATALRSALDRSAIEVVYVSCEVSDQRPLECFARVLSSAGEVSVASIVENLLKRSDNRPLLVVVDDVQWADSDTLRVIQRLAERHTSELLGVVCLGRPSESLERLRSRPVFRPVIELGGLAGADLETFCEQRLGRSVADLPAGAVEITGGLPLPLEMFVTSGGNAILATFDATQQDFVRCAAVLGDRVEVDVLSTIVEISKKETIRIVLDLEAASLLSFYEGYVRFRHPIVQRAIADSIPPVAKSRLHERIATCTVVPPLVRARHAMLAVPLIDRSIARSQATDAKHEASLLGRFGDQADLAMLLLESDGELLRLNPQEEIELLLEAATATERAGRFGAELFRERALAAAEVSHDHQSALRIILEPSIQGRSASMVITNDWITRALTFVHAEPNDDAIVGLRSERLMRAGLNGGIDELLVDVVWARAMHSKPDCPRRSELIRALITSTIGSTDFATRFALTDELFQISQHGLPGSIDEDVRADALSLHVRSAMEAGNLPDVLLASHCFEPVDEPHRNVDHWAAQAVRAGIAALSQNLGASIALAYDAAVLGTSNGIADAFPVWMLQSSELAECGAPPARGVIDPTMTFLPGDETHRPLAESSRNAHAYVGAFSALSLARIGEHLQAQKLLRIALEVHHPASTDLLMLPAAGLAVEACWLLRDTDSPVIIPNEIVELFRQLETTHVLVGATPVWSLGPASRFVALAEVMKTRAGLHAGVFSAVIEQCKGQGQGLWAARTLSDFNQFR